MQSFLQVIKVFRIFSKNQPITGQKNSELDNHDFFSLEGLQLAGLSTCALGQASWRPSRLKKSWLSSSEFFYPVITQFFEYILTTSLGYIKLYKQVRIHLMYNTNMCWQRLCSYETDNNIYRRRFDPMPGIYTGDIVISILEFSNWGKKNQSNFLQESTYHKKF